MFYVISLNYRQNPNLLKSEEYLPNEDEIISSDDFESSDKIKSFLKNKDQEFEFSKDQKNSGASKNINFNKKERGKKEIIKINLENLKKISRLGRNHNQKKSHKLIANTFKDDLFSRTGRLTSSQIPWTSRSPYTNKKDLMFEDTIKNLKNSDFGSGRRGKDKNLQDPSYIIKQKNLKEKHRLEQIEQWKRENGHKKSKLSSGRIPQQYLKKLEAGGGLVNSYSGKEGISQLYHKHKSKLRGGHAGGGSLTSGQMNLKNFSSNAQMYNYGTNNHNTLNFSKNKFGMKPRMTNYMGNSGKLDSKYFTNSRNQLRNTDHIMPEINKKSKLC